MLACPRPIVEVLEGRVLLAADVILEWNHLAIDAQRAELVHLGPGWASRNMAMVHAAMFDAVNGVVGTYEPYLVRKQAPPKASIKAAAASAADLVLDKLYPQQKATFDAALADDLARIPDAARKAAGVQWGRYVARKVLADRADDGSGAPMNYTPGTDPGDWQPTPPDFTSALGPDWGQVRPFVMDKPNDFLPPPPPALTSDQYTAAFNQVKELGAADSATRTADQTEIADFWAYDRASMGTPVMMFNQVAATVARQEHNTLVEDARLFALLNLAMADAIIVAWDAKYADNFWRPVTAVRNADNDGNPDTIGDPTWMPLGMPGTSNMTPPFPAYVSGHSTMGAAAFKVLADFYGTDRISFDAHSDELPGVVRHYDSFSQASAENGISRIYMGIHWSFDNVNGKAAGRVIGNWVYHHALKPNARVAS